MSRNNPRVEVPGHEIRGRWEKDSEDQDASASGGDLVAKNAVFEKEVESSVSRKQVMGLLHSPGETPLSMPPWTPTKLSHC